MVKCFVVGCFTGYTSNKENDCKVFKAPKYEKAFILCGKSMERNDRKFSRKDHVCSKHFAEEFVIKNSVNGGHQLSRRRLRDDAIPTLHLGIWLKLVRNYLCFHKTYLYVDYKDGAASNKIFKKKTKLQFQSQSEDKNVRKTLEGSNIDVTLSVEPECGNVVQTSQEDFLGDTQIEDHNFVRTTSQEEFLGDTKIKDHNFVQTTSQKIIIDGTPSEEPETFSSIPIEAECGNLDQTTTSELLKQLKT